MHEQPLRPSSASPPLDRAAPPCKPCLWCAWVALSGVARVFSWQQGAAGSGFVVGEAWLTAACQTFWQGGVGAKIGVM